MSDNQHQGAHDVTRVPRRPGAGLACYVNYAVHLENVGGNQISADLPHTVSECLNRAHGLDLVTVYTNGCRSDVNHIDVTWGEPQHGHDNAAQMGIILAAEVLRNFPKLNVQTGIPTG